MESVVGSNLVPFVTDIFNKSVLTLMNSRIKCKIASFVMYSSKAVFTINRGN